MKKENTVHQTRRYNMLHTTRTAGLGLNTPSKAIPGMLQGETGLCNFSILVTLAFDARKPSKSPIDSSPMKKAGAAEPIHRSLYVSSKDSRSERRAKPYAAVYSSTGRCTLCPMQKYTYECSYKYSYYYSYYCCIFGGLCWCCWVNLNDERLFTFSVKTGPGGCG